VRFNGQDFEVRFRFVGDWGVGEDVIFEVGSLCINSLP